MENEFDRFKIDFQNEKQKAENKLERNPFSLCKNAKYDNETKTMIQRVFYTLNDKEYEPIKFWTLFTKYHCEIVEGLEDTEKIIYLNRIITQIRVITDQHFENLLNFKLPFDFCDNLIEGIKKVSIKMIENRKADFERFLAEHNQAKSETSFDLINYSDSLPNIAPFWNIKKDAEYYHVFKGILGKEYSYYKVLATPRKENFCNSFFNNYCLENNQHNTDKYLEDIEALIEYCKLHGIERLSGYDAYLKYWNANNTPDEMTRLGFRHKVYNGNESSFTYSTRNGFIQIFHFEALKEWFNFLLNKHLEKCNNQLADTEVIQSQKKEYLKAFIEETAQWLNTSAKRGNGIEYQSSISKATAKQFIQFYEYLKERLNELQPTAPTTTDKQQANKVITPNNLEQMENINHFNKFMPIELAENHFKVFTDAKHKKGNTPFLSKEAFEQFIKKAFHGKSEIEKQKLNVGTREKWFIVKRFYEFYKIGIGENEGLQYESTTQCREKYIRLLTDNFTNWSYNEIENNFNKEVKRAW